jgi:hypothetical protein
VGYCGTRPTPKLVKSHTFNAITSARYLQFIEQRFWGNCQGHAHAECLVGIDGYTWMLVDCHVDAGAGRFTMGVTQLMTGKRGRAIIHPTTEDATEEE